MKQLKIIKVWYSVFAVILLLFGLVVCVEPEISENWMMRIGAVILIAFGILKIESYFSKDILQLAFQFDLALGIISCLMGVVVLVRGRDAFSVIISCIGMLMMFDALLKVQTAIDAKKVGMKKWWLILIISICVAMIGVLLTFKPFEERIILLRIVGLNLIIDGVLNLYVVQSTVNTLKRKRDFFEG